jgi:uncharacterized alpha-E superfamily protein
MIVKKAKKSFAEPIASAKASAKPTVDIAERKRKQYQEAIEARNGAKAGIRTIQHKLAFYRENIAASQNRIAVVEYLLATDSDPTISAYLIAAVEKEAAAIKQHNDHSLKHRDALTAYRKELSKAEKAIASILENGPDMQNTFPDDDEP